MKEALLVIQIISGVIVSGLVLVQSKGSGLGRAWGGGGGTSFTRRGLERVLFKSTFVFSALFIVLAIAQLVV